MNWLKRFFRRLWGEESSRSIAKSRLRLILIHDRADIPPGLLEEIKDEIIALIAAKLTMTPKTSSSI
jgi:cell division topological specificity factor